MREDIRDSAFGNVGTLAAFRVSAEDSEYLEKQFAPEFSAHDLVNQENLNGIIKLIIDGIPARPFNYLIKFPLPGQENKEVGAAIIELSRLKNARPRDLVDAEVIGKMDIKGPVAPQPGGVPRDGVG